MGADILRQALQTAHLQHIDRGRFLIQQGEPATTFYLLVQGHAKHIQYTQDGHTILIQYIHPGREIGVIALLSGFEYPYAVQTLADCRALVWPGEALAQLMERHPRLSFNALRVMVNLMIDQERRYAELLIENVEQRVAQALLRLAEQIGRPEANCILIDMSLPREDLAEFTGTTLYTASRILSKWERQGLIATGRERVLICRLDALTRIAGNPAIGS